MERWTRVRRRTAATALVIGLVLGAGTTGIAGATTHPQDRVSNLPETTEESTAYPTTTETTDQMTETTRSETTGESDEERRIEFINCSAVRVTGEFERIAVESTFYAADGLGTNTQEFGPIDGTIVIDLSPGDGLAGESVDIVSAYENGSGPVTVERENPNKEQCWNDIRPEPADISFVGAEPLGNGTYEATFEYTNPNDEALSVAGSRFTSGTVTADPPIDLQPGTHTFSVEWRPERDDERLTWELDLRPFGHEAINASGTLETERTTTDSDDDDGPESAEAGDETDESPRESDVTTRASDQDDSAEESSGSDDASDRSGTSADAGANEERSARVDETRTASGSDASNDADAASDATAAERETTEPTAEATPESTSEPTTEPAAEPTIESNTGDDEALAGETETYETQITGGVESSGQPGMGIVSALVAVLATALLAVRR